MKTELDSLRAQRVKVGPGGSIYGSDRKPVHWMKMWGLSGHIGEADIAANLLSEGRHEIYRRCSLGEDNMPYLECVCGAMIPGDKQTTLSRAEFLHAPGHLRAEEPADPVDPQLEPDPWLAEYWEPAAVCATRGGLLARLHEEQSTLGHLLHQVVADHGEDDVDDGTSEWLAGANRHLTRLARRIHAVQFGDHRPFVHEQDPQGVWWLVCSCGARIEGRLGQTLNESGFNSDPDHYSLRKELDKHMRPRHPAWMTYPPTTTTVVALEKPIRDQDGNAGNEQHEQGEHRDPEAHREGNCQGERPHESAPSQLTALAVWGTARPGSADQLPRLWRSSYSLR